MSITQTYPPILQKNNLINATKVPWEPTGRTISGPSWSYDTTSNSMVISVFVRGRVDITAQLVEVPRLEVRISNGMASLGAVLENPSPNGNQSITYDVLNPRVTFNGEYLGASTPEEISQLFVTGTSGWNLDFIIGDTIDAVENLGDLGDVDIQLPIENDDVLTYDLASATWTNLSVPRELDDLSNVNTNPPFDAGGLLTWDGAQWTALSPLLQDSTNVVLAGESEGQVLTLEAGNWINKDIPPATVTSLNDVGDVVIDTPTDGQQLVWDTATSKWINDDIIVDQTTGTNIGNGSGEVFSAEVGDELQFRTLESSDPTHIAITTSGPEVIFTYTAGVGDASDVTLTAPATTQVLKKSAGDWVNGAVDYSELTGTPPAGTYDGLTDTTITAARQTGDTGVWNAFTSKWETVSNNPSGIYYRYDDPRLTGVPNVGKFSIAGNFLYIHPDSFATSPVTSTIVPNLKAGDMVVIQCVNADYGANGSSTVRFAIAGDGALQATEGDYLYPISDAQSTGSMVGGFQYTIDLIISSSTVTAHNLADHLDVAADAPTDGDLLTWDAVGSEWAPLPPILVDHNILQHSDMVAIDNKLIWDGDGGGTENMVSYQPGVASGFAYSDMEASVTGIRGHWDYSDLTTFDDAGMAALTDRVSGLGVFYRNTGDENAIGTAITAVQDVIGPLSYIRLDNDRNTDTLSQKDLQGDLSSNPLDPTVDGFTLGWVMSDVTYVLSAPSSDNQCGAFRIDTGIETGRFEYDATGELQVDIWTDSGFYTDLTTGYNIITESAAKRVFLTLRYRASDNFLEIRANGNVISSGVAPGGFAGKTIPSIHWGQYSAYADGISQERPSHLRGYSQIAIDAYMTDSELQNLWESVDEEFNGNPRPVGTNSDANLTLTQCTDVALTTTTAGDSLRFDGTNFVNWRFPMGSIFWNDNVTVTTISAINVWTKVAGVSTLRVGVGYDMPVDGRLRFTRAGETVHNHIVVQFSAFAAGNNRECEFQLYKNGVADGIVLKDNLHGTNPIAGALHTDLMLTENDYIELWVRNIENADDVTVSNMYMFSMGMNGA